MVAVIAVAAAALALYIHAHHLEGVPDMVRSTAASLVLFAICGDALAYALIPGSWRPLRPLFSLPLGAAAGALVLTAFGVAHVPLHASLWLTLAIFIGASVVARTRGLADTADPPVEWSDERRTRATWVAVLALIWLVALIPLGRTGI